VAEVEPSGGRGGYQISAAAIAATRGAGEAEGAVTETEARVREGTGVRARAGANSNPPKSQRPSRAVAVVLKGRLNLNPMQIVKVTPLVIVTKPVYLNSGIVEI
tara:strand:+ start:345 stop:656 length:312 start_codon:yes stop_codon:yes gene_type:complete